MFLLLFIHPPFPFSPTHQEKKMLKSSRMIISVAKRIHHVIMIFKTKNGGKEKDNIRILIDLSLCISHRMIASSTLLVLQLITFLSSFCFHLSRFYQDRNNQQHYPKKIQLEKTEIWNLCVYVCVKKPCSILFRRVGGVSNNEIYKWWSWVNLEDIASWQFFVKNSLFRISRVQISKDNFY